jgi:hypothetical protein
MRSDPNLRALKWKQPDPMTGVFYHDTDGWYLVRWNQAANSGRLRV